jgi:hypothetical protein
MWKSERKKRPCVRSYVGNVLARDGHGHDESFRVARQPLAAQADERLVVVVEQQAVLVAIDAELVENRRHLRREREIGPDALLLTDNDPNLVDKLCFSLHSQGGTGEPERGHFERVASEELRDAGDAVADDIVQ